MSFETRQIWRRDVDAAVRLGKQRKRKRRRFTRTVVDRHARAAADRSARDRSSHNTTLGRLEHERSDEHAAFSIGPQAKRHVAHLRTDRYPFLTLPPLPPFL